MCVCGKYIVNRNEVLWQWPRLPVPPTEVGLLTSMIYSLLYLAFVPPPLSSPPFLPCHNLAIKKAPRWQWLEEKMLFEGIWSSHLVVEPMLCFWLWGRDWVYHHRGVHFETPPPSPNLQFILWDWRTDMIPCTVSGTPVGYTLSCVISVLGVVCIIWVTESFPTPLLPAVTGLI